jgi:exopolysaccharide production protein ExoQ
VKIRITPNAEKLFALFALCFFSKTLDFNSLFIASEGVNIGVESYNPLSPVLSLFQHSIFLVTVFLLLLRQKMLIHALSRNIFISVLILIFLFSFTWSEFPDFTLRRSISLLETTSFGIYFGSRFNVRDQLRLLSFAFLFLIALNILFVLAFPHSGIELGKHAGAWRGTLEHKNYLSRLMVLGLLVFKCFSPESKKESRLKLVGITLSFALVALSTSKTGLLTSMILVILMMPAYSSLRWKFKTATAFQSSLVLTLSLFTTIVIGNLTTLETVLGRDLTLTGRTEIWQATLRKLYEKPWLGFGYQGFWHGDNGPFKDVLRFIGPGAYASHSHNGFLELATAVGIIGLATFALGFLLTFSRALRYVTTDSSSFVLWPIMYLSFLLISNQTELTLVDHNSIFWVLCVALSLSKYTSTTPLPSFTGRKRALC